MLIYSIVMTCWVRVQCFRFGWKKGIFSRTAEKLAQNLFFPFLLSCPKCRVIFPGFPQPNCFAAFFPSKLIFFHTFFPGQSVAATSPVARYSVVIQEKHWHGCKREMHLITFWSIYDRYTLIAMAIAQGLLSTFPL